MTIMTTGWRFAVAAALLATTAACAEQSTGLGGAAVPQGLAAATTPADAPAAPDGAAEGAAVSQAVTDAMAVDAAAAAPPVEASAAALAAVDADFIGKLLPAMTNLAAGRTPALLPHTTVYAADDTMSVALAAADGVAALTADALGRGAVIGYVYLVVADSPRWPPRPRMTMAPPRPKPFGVDPNATAEPSSAGVDAAGVDAAGDAAGDAARAAAAIALPTVGCCVSAGLRSGMYSLRVRGDKSSGAQQKLPDPRHVVDMVDSGGTVMATLGATVADAPDVAAAPWTGVTLDRGGPLTLTVRSGRWKIDASRIIP